MTFRSDLVDVPISPIRRSEYIKGAWRLRRDPQLFRLRTLSIFPSDQAAFLQRGPVSWCWWMAVEWCFCEFRGFPNQHHFANVSNVSASPPCQQVAQWQADNVFRRHAMPGSISRLSRFLRLLHWAQIAAMSRISVRA